MKCARVCVRALSLARLLRCGCLDWCCVSSFHSLVDLTVYNAILYVSLSVAEDFSFGKLFYVISKSLLFVRRSVLSFSFYRNHCKQEITRKCYSSTIRFGALFVFRCLCFEIIRTFFHAYKRIQISILTAR